MAAEWTMASVFESAETRGNVEKISGGIDMRYWAEIPNWGWTLIVLNVRILWFQCRLEKQNSETYTQLRRLLERV